MSSSSYRKYYLLLILILILLPLTAVHSRRLSSSDLLSDGLPTNSTPSYILLAAEAESCEQTYGFLPCTSTALGNTFLILVYGYLMFTAATYLSAGSELLLEILGPGIVGGLFLPILGALPDAMLILVSGLSGDTETAQSQVSVGMGLLAGSTVMLLTFIWGSCVVVGKCDIRETDSIAISGQNTRGFDLTGSGVSTDIWTCYAARIMAISIIPFLVVQLPQLLDSTSGRHLAVLIALILSVTMLISYCLYQICQPWIQRRRIAYAKHKHVISGILKHFSQHALGKFVGDDGQPDIEVMRKLFHSIDASKDGYLSASELKALILGIRFEEIDFDKEDAADKLLLDFDTSRDNKISFDEFAVGISRWIEEAKRAGAVAPHHGSQTFRFISDRFHMQTKKEHTLLGNDGGAVEDQSDEIVEGVENPKWISIKAVLMLLLGTLIAAAFADPLVDAVDNFSTATSIPTFFISFIALPLATNSSEAVSAIIFASRKSLRTASLTFSELYGAVTMNNLLCLSVFLALVYVRGLTWDFSSEVLVIFIVCMVMGGFASFRTTFPIWTSSLAYFLYPFSLALVYVLDYVFGWS
ncbi:sodium/calcium exchanger family protein / calcium-binding EF hand family protein [Euphorbia peplus]|nr:sodium/calcium exchanger family protein / calcium-binding EF hand family protein [Euphorbia peplus]